MSLAGQGVAAAAPQVAEAAKAKLNEQGIDLTGIRNEAETLLRQTGKPALQPENLQAQAQLAGTEAQGPAKAAAENPQQAEGNLDSLMKNLFHEGQDTVAAVNVVAARTGKPRPEAEKIVDRWDHHLPKRKAPHSRMRVAHECEYAGLA